ncbi:MAG: SufS family cysteine desulfurase [Myxococcales bacterium]|nr:MAG: SufS family cysteine desulfurase [Myxococcales bacterium]
MGRVRDLFPIFSEPRRKKLVYLDSASTSQKPRLVIDAEADYYRTTNASVHRGNYELSAESTQLYEQARARVAAFVNAPAPESVVYVRSTTTAINTIANGLAHRLKPGDEILLTEMEHHANLVPWIMLAKRMRLSLRYIPVTEAGDLDLSMLNTLLTRKTRVVAITHLSNVLGTIVPVAEIARTAKQFGAVVVIDAAQAIGHMPLDFQAIGADLLAFSAHKCYGPPGLGFMIGAPEILDLLEPFEGGGQMIHKVFYDDATWAPVPQKFEAGTPNSGAAIAFPAALDLLEAVGLERIRAHERDLAGYTLEKLRALPSIKILGPLDPDKRGGLVSFYDEHIHPHDLATLLDERGVAVRAGHHCAQPLHRKLGLTASARASFGIYTTRDDIDALIDALHFARSYFTR